MPNVLRGARHFAKSNESLFVSAYLSPPGARSVLAPRHDQGIVLWRANDKEIELVRAWQMERLSGQKHHYWPVFALDRGRDLLEHLLATEGVAIRDVTAVWGTPGLPMSKPIAVPPGSDSFPKHELAHLFGALLSDSRRFKQELLVGLAVDGGPDFVLDNRLKRSWYPGCISDRGEISYTAVESPAPLYAAARSAFGDEPGTLMALASATRCTVNIDAERVAASVRLFGGTEHPLSQTLPLVRRLVGEATDQLQAPHGERHLDSRFTFEENLKSAVMKVVQRSCELIYERNIERLFRHSRHRPKDAYFAASGGFALNCPANSRLIEHFGFRGLIAPPCADDSGQAYGIGLLGLYCDGAFESADFNLTTAAHGNSDLQLKEALTEWSPWIQDVGTFDSTTFVSDVITGPVAWIDGSAELGPRALGNRSLLGDPRSDRMRDDLNRIKQRQWWRPVAPIVLAEYVSKWFSFSRSSPFMLEIAEVLPSLRDHIPAIAHLDGSARLQTLDRSSNPRLRQALEAFHHVTGVPVLCNTSLNDKGEPIADNASQALNFCVRRDVKVLYIEGTRVSLVSSGSQSPPVLPEPRQTQWFTAQEKDHSRAWKHWINLGYSPGGMFLLSRSPELAGRAEDPSVCKRINELAVDGAERDPAFAGGVQRFVESFSPSAVFDPTCPPAAARWIED